MKDNCWTEIHNHPQEFDLFPAGTWKVFEVQRCFAASRFRIISTGADFQGKTCLCLSGFELYGELFYK
jgi:hypothetical protein